VPRYTIDYMIKSFKCKHTQSLFEGGNPRPFRAFNVIAERKLLMLNKSVELKDLRSPPGNRLEKLSGTRDGLMSIRINNQWRICFEWRDNNSHNVEIVDYH